MEFTLPVRLPAKAPGKSGRLDLDSRMADARDARARAQERRVPVALYDSGFPAEKQEKPARRRRLHAGNLRAARFLRNQGMRQRRFALCLE